jgi:hypothetical protein
MRAKKAFDFGHLLKFCPANSEKILNFCRPFGDFMSKG